MLGILSDILKSMCSEAPVITQSKSTNQERQAVPLANIYRQNLIPHTKPYKLTSYNFLVTSHPVPSGSPPRTEPEQGQTNSVTTIRRLVFYLHSPAGGNLSSHKIACSLKYPSEPEQEKREVRSHPAISLLLLP